MLMEVTVPIVGIKDCIEIYKQNDPNCKSKFNNAYTGVSDKDIRYKKRNCLANAISDTNICAGYDNGNKDAGVG